MTRGEDDIEPFKNNDFLLDTDIARPISVPLVPPEAEDYFGYTGILNEETAQKVWELCNRQH